MPNDAKWMEQALALAERGRGSVSPNPMVGAVVVRGGRLIGRGWHRRFGGPHAEVEALRDAGSAAKGATLYVTLEPCAHWGKTPPCAEAVAAAGIREVVAAMRDPNPRVAGKGFAFLRKQGIRVRSGVLQEEAGRLNRAFVTWVTKKRPYVTLKRAVSLDGRTATVTGESKWITGPGARGAGHALRAEADAIAVGAGTVLKDNPGLTAHGRGRNPVRVIFAGRRNLPKRAKVFTKEAATRVIRGATTPAALRRALAALAEDGISHLLVEGGEKLQRSFLEAGLADEVAWFIAPLIIGEQKRLKKAWRLKHVTLGSVDEDIFVRGVI